MKKWEEILKDSLEGYESTLPDDGLAQFREKLTASRNRSTNPFLILVPALALIVAAFVFWPERKPEESMIAELVNEPSNEPASVSFSAPVFEPEVESVQASSISLPVPKKEQRHQTSQIVEARSTAEPSMELPATVPEDPEPSESVAEPFVAAPQFEQDMSPVRKKPVVKAGIGGAGALAMAALLLSPKEVVSNEYWGLGGTFLSSPAFRRYDSSSPALKFGASVRIPVAERLFITTGVEFSSYVVSRTRYYGDVEMTRNHSIDVPLRLDWVFARAGTFDFYTGIGVAPDFCLTSGKNVFSLALVDAVGVQWNMSRSLGLYLEPQISWPGKVQPVMFSTALGVRFNIQGSR